MEARHTAKETCMRKIFRWQKKSNQIAIHSSAADGEFKKAAVIKKYLTWINQNSFRTHMLYPSRM